MGAEETVEYVYEERKVKFVVKRLTYGQYQKVMSGAGNVELIGGITKGRIDTTKLIHELMKVSVSGEIDFDLLDVMSGMDLQDRVLKINGLSGETTFRPDT